MVRYQNSAEPGDLGKGIASLIFSIPVANCTSLSNPNPKARMRNWKKGQKENIIYGSKFLT